MGIGPLSLAPAANFIGFGTFELDLRSRELRKDGRSTRLPEQSIKVLHMVLERPGDLILRHEIRARLWPNGAVVDFDHSINSAMRKLRLALGDSADNPRYIETLARRGYRWIGPITRNGRESDAPASQVPNPNPTGLTIRTATPARLVDKSVAVLPFVDMSALHDQEYFADGLVEETLHLLFKVPALNVIARTSAFEFKGRSEDVRAIGAKLGVTYVVEGSVRRSGDHLRVTAQLIETRTALRRWSATYDRDVEDGLRVQREIAAALARGIQLEIASSNQEKDFGSPFFLRGLHAEARFDLAGFDEAIGCYKQALMLEPTFLPAAEALARALKGRAEWGFAPPHLAWREVRLAAERALRLDPHSALAHALLSRLYSEYDWDWSMAAREADTAMALAPNDPDVLTSAAIARLATGEFNDAAHLLDMACIIDPLNADTHLIKGWAYLRLERFADAERISRLAIELSPTYVWAHHDLGLVLLCQGRYEEALVEMNREPHMGGKLSGIAIAYHALRRCAESDAALSTLIAEGAGEMALKIAEVHAFRRENDQAIQWLERAYRQRDFDLYSISGSTPFARMRMDSSFVGLLRQMRLR